MTEADAIERRAGAYLIQAERREMDKPDHWAFDLEGVFETLLGFGPEAGYLRKRARMLIVTARCIRERAEREAGAYVDEWVLA